MTYAAKTPVVLTRDWKSDRTTPAFEQRTIPLPSEGDGELVATILRHKKSLGSRKAFLYLHGFIDYFFHDHVADAVRAAGWDFYAIDLRRHGRSLRNGNRPNCCTDLEQYYVEITAAIDIVMKEDAHDTVVLYGHSTGGLLASLYADNGERRAQLAGVVLNSPFVDFNVGGLQRLKLPIAVTIGGRFPFLSDPKAVTPMYGESLHVSKRGEWNYDLRWKPIEGFAAYFGWVRAIRHGHLRVHKGLSVRCPVLVLQSDATGGGKVWNDNFKSRDIVLDVEHMRRYCPGIGPRVTRTEIPGAVHDVMLSQPAVRAQALDVMTKWLESAIPGSAIHNSSNAS